MEHKDENLRERLLARLPQPENVAAYREETVSLLARHEKALFWEKWSAIVIAWLGLALWLVANSTWGLRLSTNQTIVFDWFAGVLVLTGGLYGVQNHVSRSKVDLLKELKQVQLQILELQAGLEKTTRREP